MRENTPTLFVIFGVTGDLAKQKLLVALFHLFERNMLPATFRIVGFSRKDMTEDEFQNYLTEVLDAKKIKKGELRTRFLKVCSYVQGDFEKSASYVALGEALKAVDDKIGQCTNKLYYLAVPPTLYESISKNLAESGLTSACDDENGWTRVLVEKPFGNDLKTAKKLDQLLGRLFREEQIFRIDHYLAKEAMQNILAFRFSNSIFEPLWNHEHVEKVEIQFFERDTIGSRGAFYDSLGALRDVGQNHMLQMLALIAMDRPESFSGSSIQAARAAALAALKPITRQGILESLARGQYEGYREESNVHPDSSKETYFRLRLEVKSERWNEVPFFLESGKALAEEKMEIAIFFRKKECICADREKCTHQNRLTFRIQPGAGITLSLWTKEPGFGFNLVEKTLSFLYERDAELELIDAYERVLFDCFRGDQMLFASTDEVLASWRFIAPIVEGLERVPLATYPKGSWGPGK